MAVVVALSCGRAELNGVQVDRVEDGWAVLLDSQAGTTRVVAAASLPPGTAEGDVVIDGRSDPQLRLANEQAVEQARARLVRSALRSGEALDAPAPAGASQTR